MSTTTNPDNCWCVWFQGLFLAVLVCIWGGQSCSDVNQLEQTVLSSGVISYCVVLHNDPQWRTLSKEHGNKMGEGCSSPWRFFLLSLSLTASQSILGSFDHSGKERNQSKCSHETDGMKFLRETLKEL